MQKELITLIVVPLIIGIILDLFAYWLSKRNGD